MNMAEGSLMKSPELKRGTVENGVQIRGLEL